MGQRFHIYLDDDLAAEIDALCLSEGRARSQQIARMLRKALQPRTWTKRLHFINRTPTPEDAVALLDHLSELGGSLAAGLSGGRQLELTGDPLAIETALPHLEAWLSEVDREVRRG